MHSEVTRLFRASQAPFKSLSFDQYAYQSRTEKHSRSCATLNVPLETTSTHPN
jgi:putative heme iron utilization protein